MAAIGTQNLTTTCGTPVHLFFSLTDTAASASAIFLQHQYTCTSDSLLQLMMLSSIQDLNTNVDSIVRRPTNFLTRRKEQLSSCQPPEHWTSGFNSICKSRRSGRFRGHMALQASISSKLVAYPVSQQNRGCPMLTACSRSPGQAKAALTCLRKYRTPITNEIISDKASTEKLYEAARILGEQTVDAASTRGEAAAVKLLLPGMVYHLLQKYRTALNWCRGPALA